MLARTNHLDWVPTEQRKGKKSWRKKKPADFFHFYNNAQCEFIHCKIWLLSLSVECLLFDAREL